MRLPADLGSCGLLGFSSLYFYGCNPYFCAFPLWAVKRNKSLLEIREIKGGSSCKSLPLLAGDNV